MKPPIDPPHRQPALAGSPPDEVLRRRLDLAAGGICIGITNKAGTESDKCAHFKAMPGGPSEKYPNRPKGPGPRDRGAQYYATTDANTIREWTLTYPGCHTFIGGFLPPEVACLDIDRFQELLESCPGLFESLKAAGFPMDKRVGHDRYHIWVRVPEGATARDILPANCVWGEIKWTGGLVVSSPSPKYEAAVPLKSWDDIPRLSQDQIRLIIASRSSARAPRGAANWSKQGRHPALLGLSAKLAAQLHSREYIIDAVYAADLASDDPAQLDPNRPGDFDAEVERMVDGAIKKFGHGDYLTPVPTSRQAPLTENTTLPKQLMELDGLAGKIADHINAQSIIYNPELAFWASLAGVAHACGRYITTSTGLNPGFGVIVLAPSTAGKEKPQEVLNGIFFGARYGHTVIHNLTSGQAIEDRLEVEPKLLLLADEAMHLFRAMADPRQSQFSAEKILKELLSGKTDYLCRARAKYKNRHVKPIPIYRPHLTLYGSAVPSEFLNAINDQMVQGGLFGRLLCPLIGRGVRKKTAPLWEAVPASIISDVALWEALLLADAEISRESSLPKLIPYSARGERRWNEYSASAFEVATSASTELSATLWGRAAEKAARLALVRAAGREGISLSQVELADVDWACAVVDHSTTQLIRVADCSIATNDTEKNRNKIIEIMRQYMQANPGAASVPHSFVLKNSKLRGRECNETVIDLVECGDIQIHEGTPGRNHKRARSYSFPARDSQVPQQIPPTVVNRSGEPNGRKRSRKG